MSATDAKTALRQQITDCMSANVRNTLEKQANRVLSGHMIRYFSQVHLIV
jgi:hypothetical protein